MELEPTANEETVEQDDEPEEPEVKVKREISEEDITRLNEERWPNVNGVYDADGEWHDWNDITYSYGYENAELIILPYTVCVINSPVQQYVSESSSD